MTVTFAPAAVTAVSGNRKSQWVRVGRGVAVGLTLAAVTILARWSGILHGKLALGVFVLAMLAIPISRQLSRRILLSACLAFGWIPLLWWWPLPVGDLGRGTLLLALMVGGLGGWVAAGRQPLTRCRAVIPNLNLVDAYPFILALLSAAVLYPWLRAKSGASALSMLMAGWDHSAHFGMVHQIRQAGVTVDVAAPPAAGGVWQFSSYPQSFHAVAATVIELLTGPRVGDISTELVVFSQVMAIMSICFVVMLVAGICALPVLRRRPAIALPISTFVAAVFIFGPGATALPEGFVNFSFACALVAAIALIAVAMPRVFSPLHLAAIGGAVVGIANGWILLLVLAAPVTLIALVPFRRSRWSTSRGRAIASGAIILVVLLCVGRGAVVVSRVPVDNLLLVKGGITPPGIGLALIAVLGCLALCVVVGRCHLAVPGRRILGSAVRVRALIGLPIVATLGAAYLVALQLSSGTTLTYYFMKYITGVEIVSFVVMMIPFAFILTHWTPLRRLPVGAVSTMRLRFRRATSRTSVSAAAVSLALAFAATQAFGFASPNLTRIALPPTAPGAVNRVFETTRIVDPPMAATNLIDVALRLKSEYPGKTVVYFDFPSDRRVHPMIPAQWYFALTSTWFRADNELAGNLDFYDYTVEAVASSASRILNDRPDAYVAVGADWVDVIRGLLSPRVPADHVVAW